MPLLTIPVSFEYEGIQFDGHFSTSSGNENVWHLDLNKYHYGQLVKYSSGWQWRPNASNLFNEPWMLDYFVSLV